MKRCVFLLAALPILLAASGARALEPSDIKLDQWNVTVDGKTFGIEPPSVRDGTFDAELKVGVPTWQGPIYLPGPAWVFEARLRPESLVATLASDPKAVLEKGKDYAVDPALGTVGALQGGKYPAGTKVHFAYQYGMSRIDLIVRGKDGKLALIKGKEDRTEPLLPETPAGAIPVLSIYLPNAGRPLTADDINLIDPNYDGVPPVSRADELKTVKEKIATGKPVTIVFLGDSITAQQPKDFRDNQGSFVDRFAAWLKKSHSASTVVEVEYGKPVPPAEGKQIRIIKAGVGGDDTVRALKRVDKDVLAQQPDAVVVMLGVNDENKSATGNEVAVAKYKANLEEIIDKIAKTGAKVVLMTPSMKNLGWAGTGGNMADYAKAMREVAAEKKTCLVDNFAAWQSLPKRGYNYMVFLGNCLNHPVDLGHDLFFRGLKAAFETSGD